MTVEYSNTFRCFECHARLLVLREKPGDLAFDLRCPRCDQDLIPKDAIDPCPQCGVSGRTEGCHTCETDWDTATCEEVLMMVGEQYIRCGDPAVMVVKHVGRREGPYRMCAGHGTHNVANRGAVIWRSKEDEFS